MEKKYFFEYFLMLQNYWSSNFKTVHEKPSLSQKLVNVYGSYEKQINLTAVYLTFDASKVPVTQNCYE